MKHELCEAAAQVRAACGQTQQDFANRVSWAISTVARYETSRPPKGKALSVYAALAASHELVDVCQLFRTELLREVGQDFDNSLTLGKDMDEIVADAKKQGAAEALERIAGTMSSQAVKHRPERLVVPAHYLTKEAAKLREPAPIQEASDAKP